MYKRIEIPVLYYFASPLTDPHSTAILRGIPLEDLCLLTLFQHMIEQKWIIFFPSEKFYSKARLFCERSSHGLPPSAALVYFSV